MCTYWDAMNDPVWSKHGEDPMQNTESNFSIAQTMQYQTTRGTVPTIEKFTIGFTLGRKARAVASLQSECKEVD